MDGRTWYSDWTEADYCFALTVELLKDAIARLADASLMEEQYAGTERHAVAVATCVSMEDDRFAGTWADVAAGDRDAGSAIAHTRAGQRS